MTGATVSRSSIVLGPMADKASLQRTPGALRNGAPLTEMPDTLRQLQDNMARVKKAVTESLSCPFLRKGTAGQWMVDILSLVLQHNEEDVLCTVELALEAGVPPRRTS